MSTCNIIMLTYEFFYVIMKHDNVNIRLINNISSFMRIEWSLFVKTCIPLTKVFFVLSLVKIGSVLAQLSRKLKWTFLIACCPSVFIFTSPSQDENWTTEPISTKLGTELPWVKGYDLFQGGGGARRGG